MYMFFFFNVPSSLCNLSRLFLRTPWRHQLLTSGVMLFGPFGELTQGFFYYCFQQLAARRRSWSSSSPCCCSWSWRPPPWYHWPSAPWRCWPSRPWWWANWRWSWQVCWPCRSCWPVVKARRPTRWWRTPTTRTRTCPRTATSTATTDAPSPATPTATPTTSPTTRTRPSNKSEVPLPPHYSKHAQYKPTPAIYIDSSNCILQCYP